MRGREGRHRRVPGRQRLIRNAHEVESDAGAALGDDDRLRQRAALNAGDVMLKLLQAFVRRILTKERAEVGMACCGIVALLTPLLLWVSWSVDGLKIILMIGFASFLLATWFAQYAAPEFVDPEEERLPKPGELPLPGQADAKPETWRDTT